MIDTVPMLLGLDWLDPETLLDWMGGFAFWGMLLVIFAECGLFALLPGDSLLFVTGLFIADGWAYAPGLVPTILAIVAAAWLGNLCGYAIGWRVGPALFKPKARIFKQEYADTSHEFFEKYGPRAIILARFVPIVRTFITVIAGAGAMNRARFFGWSLVGAVLWATGLTLIGYFLGEAVPALSDHLELAVLLIVGVSVLPMVFEYWKHRREVNQAAEEIADDLT